MKREEKSNRMFPLAESILENGNLIKSVSNMNLKDRITYNRVIISKTKIARIIW